MSFKFKISKENYNVLEENGVNLLFNAELASHSIFKIMSVGIPLTVGSINFPHGLDFIPKVWIFMQQTDGDGDYLIRIPYSDETTFNVDYYITDERIFIETDGNHTTGLDFKVIIFTRSAQP